MSNKNNAKRKSYNLRELDKNRKRMKGDLKNNSSDEYKTPNKIKDIQKTPPTQIKTRRKQAISKTKKNGTNNNIMPDELVEGDRKKDDKLKDSIQKKKERLTTDNEEKDQEGTIENFLNFSGQRKEFITLLESMEESSISDVTLNGALYSGKRK